MPLSPLPLSPPLSLLLSLLSPPLLSPPPEPSQQRLFRQQRSRKRP